jgi:hypothetical protein
MVVLTAEGNRNTYTPHVPLILNISEKEIATDEHLIFYCNY